MVDEVEQAVVGEVQVLEDEHERTLLGERLEEAPPGGERLAAPVGARLAAASSPTSGRRLRPSHCASAGRRRALRSSSRSFSSARAASSVSSTPACAFTISPSAQ